jgi:serine/threonine protein kinase
MTTLTPNGEDSVIAAFMQQFEGADDKAAVVRQFADRHPDLGPAFADYAAGHSLLKDAGPGSEPTGQLLRPGETLGDFRVVRLIDKGGMGEIYEAEQVRLKRRRVALKVICKGRAVPEARARFDREQAVLANLHQTNIVPVFANGEKGEVQYFAMQYIDGATLGRVVKHLQTRHNHPDGSNPTSSLAKLVESAVGPAPGSAASTVTAGRAGSASEPAGVPATPVLTDEYLRSVAASLADVADALHAAHEAGVVHRDVKPSNLMAEKSGKCWVIDFGLAGLVGESRAPADGRPLAADPALTATGSVMGTYAYMAPEQFGGDTDRRTDVWALGVTLYELLALDRPFPGPDPDDYRRQIGGGEPTDLRSVSKAVPHDLAAICRKAMRKAPAER